MKCSVNSVHSYSLTFRTSLLSLFLALPQWSFNREFPCFVFMSLLAFCCCNLASIYGGLLGKRDYFNLFIFVETSIITEYMVNFGESSGGAVKKVFSFVFWVKGCSHICSVDLGYNIC